MNPHRHAEAATVPDPSNLVLDVKGTAAALKISVPTVRRLIRRKEIPIIRLGRRVVILTEDIIAFLKKKRAEQM